MFYFRSSLTTSSKMPSRAIETRPSLTAKASKRERQSLMNPWMSTHRPMQKLSTLKLNFAPKRLNHHFILLTCKAWVCQVLSKLFDLYQKILSALNVCAVGIQIRAFKLPKCSDYKLFLVCIFDAR